MSRRALSAYFQAMLKTSCGYDRFCTQAFGLIFAMVIALHAFVRKSFWFLLEGV